jgi:putative photosynthetic complex assembly protein
MAQTHAAEGGDKIPPGLVKMMAALVVTSVAIVAFAAVTDRPLVGAPKPAEVLEQRTMILLPGEGNQVTVLEEDGRQIVALDNGGFIAVVLGGLKFERKKQGVAMNEVTTLTRYANGRLTLADPATGWSAELQAFGPGNMAAFERLLAD